MTAATAAAASDVAPARIERLTRLATYASMLLLAAPIRLWAAVSDQGLFWPDEIYQSLEQAHRVAFGFGLIPWEFQQGARSWLFPGLLGLLWKLAALLGVRDALTLVIVAKVAVVAAGLAGLWAAMRLAERLSGLTGALLAGGLCTTFPAMVVYGARAMTETVSGPLVVGAALLTLTAGVRPARWAGLLSGLAVFLRYQNGLVLVGLLALLLAWRRKHDALQFALAAGVVGVLLGGVLDWVTWGAPFHSFMEYVRFNLVEGKAAQWGTSPFDFYLRTAWSATGPALVLVPLGLAGIWKKARGLVLVALAYVLAHCFIPHKEYRFLLPILPLLFALTGAGLGELFGMLELPRWPAAVLVGSLAVQGFTGALGADFQQFGQYTDNANGKRSVWHADEDASLALLDAGRRDDLCGMVLVGVHPAWSGGYSYLHRDVPLYFRGGGAELAGANYLTAPATTQPPAGWTSVAEHGRFALFHREGGCAPRPPGWKPILP